MQYVDQKDDVQFVNLCPPDVSYLDPRTGAVVTVPPEKIPARAKNDRRYVGKINGVDVHANKFGATMDLPPRKQSVCFIVALVILQANAKLPAHERRTDLVGPDMSPAGCVRENGNVKYVKGWSVEDGDDALVPVLRARVAECEARMATLEALVAKLKEALVATGCTPGNEG